MAGKTCFVTGSTDGIGLHTAVKLAERGINVILHGRNPQRLQAAIATVQRAAAGGRISSYLADLSSMQQVKQLGQQVAKDHPDGIEVLINNAGVFMERKEVTMDGYEMTWAVNVLAPFLLTSLLLGTVRERIVNVSSISASSSMDWDNLQQEKGFSSHQSYSLSKLASQLFTLRLAQLLKERGSSVTANCLDPGTVNTKMLLAGWGACGIAIKDANNEFKLATDLALAGVSGKYFVSGRESRAANIAYDIASQQRLWGIMEEQTGAKVSTPVRA